MPKACHISACGLVTPFGQGMEFNLRGILDGNTAVSLVDGAGFGGETLPLGKISHLHPNNRFGHLMAMVCGQISKAIDNSLLQNEQTIFIISSTKGDIFKLPKPAFEIAKRILQSTIKPYHTPIIVSNACISGVASINLAAQYISNGYYKRAVVIGIDALSDFVAFGFQCLHAHSQMFCKPYSADRSGVNLGEAAAAVYLSQNPKEHTAYTALCSPGFTTNDANHISGPCREGLGLSRSISKALAKAGLRPGDIHLISAHGTATQFNDDMESLAFDRLGMGHVPVHSMKGFFGHTLGAAGVLETITSLMALEQQIAFKSLGAENLGTAKPINVCVGNVPMRIENVLKTASGFGGGNSSLILTKL